MIIKVMVMLTTTEWTLKKQDAKVWNRFMYFRTATIYQYNEFIRCGYFVNKVSISGILNKHSAEWCKLVIVFQS